MQFDYVQAAESDRDVRLPRIIESADPLTAERFNADITRRLKEYACDGSTAEHFKDKKWFKARAAVTFATDEMISYRLSFDFYCGGPFKNEFDSGVTWDLKAGSPVRFFEAFRQADDRRSLLKAALKGRVFSGCDNARLLRNNDPLEFVVVPEGVEIWPDVARVPHACKMRLKMPSVELGPFLSATSPLKNRLGAPFVGSTRRKPSP